MKLHNKTAMKVHLKHMQRVLNDSFKLKDYGKKEFERFILRCLRPELMNETISKQERMQLDYCQRAGTADLSLTTTKNQIMGGEAVLYDM